MMCEKTGDFRLRLRTLTLLVVAGLAGTAGPSAQAQEKPYPIFTADHFVAAMKTTGQAFAAVNGSLSKNEIDDAKAYLAISRDRLATTMTFWRQRKRDDAMKLLRETLGKMDDLDNSLSVEHVDVAAASAIAKQVGASCQACHALYREQDPTTKAFGFKGLTE